MKNISVVVAESNKIHDLAINPGTTAKDVLNEVGLPSSYVLSSGKGSDPWGGDEPIYGAISDGQKIFASTPVDVGATPRPFFLGFCGRCCLFCG